MGRQAKHWITAFGQTKRIGQWAEDNGLLVNTICARIARGWTDEEAITRSPKSKASRVDVNEVRRLVLSGKSLRDVGQSLDINPNSISKLCRSNEIPYLGQYERSAISRTKKIPDSLFSVPLSEGFSIPSLPFENVTIAHDTSGKAAYYCKLENIWIYGTPLIHRDDDIITYTCCHCNRVLETITIRK